MKSNFGVRLLVFAMLVVALSAASFGQVFLSVRIGPPALPIYAQPICPGPGYLWTPGYWGWNDDGGYYWVPGTWVVAPIGMLWTPGYWGWGGGFYAWHAGYWGPHIGFYGGINYGFGYGGVGFVGGEWRGGAFFYNRAVMNVDSVHITNVYNRTVVVNENHVAFNGGEGGIAARPTAQEEAAAREPHQAPLAAQTEHELAASQNRALFASENHGRPAVAATSRPGEFSGHGVVAAHDAGAPYHAPAISPKEARAPSSSGASRPEGNESNARESRDNSRGNAEDSNEQRPQVNPPSNSRTPETRSEASREESHPAKAPKASKPAKRN
ncbi:MAG: hypothetical protein WB562_19375, partial [Candidatus Sulfotelmatobacter sp.]